MEKQARSSTGVGLAKTTQKLDLGYDPDPNLDPNPVSNLDLGQLLGMNNNSPNEV